jgi:isopenicillin N synthase-like dioxygenase
MYRGLALSLDLEETYFDAFNSDPLNVLRLIHYPPQPANPLPDQRGCGAHTDFGGITLLMQDDVGGLQVWDETHGWIEAPPVPGTFVVNLGDFFSLWTNGKYRSTLHRVINTSGRQRYSVPFFANGAPDFPVSCIPTCIAAGETPKYMATTLAEHLSEMFRKINLP